MCSLTSHHLHLTRICDGRGFAFIDEFVITARSSTVWFVCTRTVIFGRRRTLSDTWWTSQSIPARDTDRDPGPLFDDYGSRLEPVILLGHTTRHRLGCRHASSLRRRDHFIFSAEGGLC